MALTRAEVEHIAELAKLGLSEEELVLYGEQLSEFLEYCRALEALDTSQIPPTAQVIPVQNVMRPDEPSPCLPQEDVLNNAPRREGVFILVPPVLE